MARTYPPLDPEEYARLRTARTAQGLRQCDVAARAGISTATYHRIETGARGAAPDVLARIAAALGLDAPPPPAAGATVTPGDLIAAARRQRGWGRTRVVRELQRVGVALTPRRLAQIERSGADWLAVARALAQTLHLPPEALGLSAGPSLALNPGDLAALLWELFYRGDLRVARPLLPTLTQGLTAAPPSPGGVWALMALAVTARDQGDGVGALHLLDLAAAQAAALPPTPPDIHAALAMRRARALTDLLPDGAAAHEVWQAVEAAQALAPRCTGRLHHVIALQTARSAAARGQPVRIWMPLLDAALTAALRDGGRDPSGVDLQPPGVIHARLDAAREAVRCGADSGARAALRTATHDADALLEHPAAPARWHVGLHLSLGDAWRMLGDLDAALDAVSAALPLLSVIRSPKLARRMHTLLMGLPPSDDRRMLLQHLRAIQPLPHEDAHA